jgi:hypothetical protein
LKVRFFVYQFYGWDNLFNKMSQEKIWPSSTLPIDKRKVVNGTLKQVRALRIIRITAHGKIWRFGTRTWNRYLILKLYHPPKKVYEYHLSLSSDIRGSVTLYNIDFVENTIKNMGKENFCRC